ncbi:MAG: DNA repair protein RecO [Propionibacteriaceae bacterium]|jgi:DNA repair protein RecO (recombination protein O)|nr:DNA repair protein RecO [Propionibacteriaceae bacterium]
MATYVDDGVVLRTTRLGEADRIVTVLTRRHGKIRAVARGVRRTSSRFGARLEPFSQADLQVVEGRTLHTIAQAVTRHPYGKAFLEDYGAFTAAEAMVETADRMVPEEGSPAQRHYLLLIGALRTLGEGTPDGPRPPGLILDSYLIRAAAASGYAPILDVCARCGAGGPHEFFHPPSGGVVCRACRPSGSSSLGPGTLAYLKALSTGDWPQTREIPAQQRGEASGIIAAFLRWHLERSVTSLAFVER